MENDLSAYFDRATSVFIVLPKKPYFDQVAAGLSLYLSLLGKKEVSVICPSPMLVEFNRLVGVDKVVQHPVERNLVIRFAGYNAMDIEKVNSEVKDEELYLVVVPQPNVKPPTKEQVSLSYSGVSCDLIVLVGGADESHFPILADPEVLGIQKIHVGLRDIRQTKDNNILSYVRSSSSVSELVADIIRELGLEVDVDTASNLIAGIEVGSNHYTSEGVTANTFQTIADLLRLGGRRTNLLFRSTSSVGQSGETLLDKTGGDKFLRGNLTPESDIQDKGKREAPEADENPPSDWLAPKIFKGTSVS